MPSPSPHPTYNFEPIYSLYFLSFKEIKIYHSLPTDVLWGSFVTHSLDKRTPKDVCGEARFIKAVHALRTWLKGAHKQCFEPVKSRVPSMYPGCQRVFLPVVCGENWAVKSRSWKTRKKFVLARHCKKTPLAPRVPSMLISLKRVRFSGHLGAKVRRQGPPGTARAQPC